MPCSRPIAFRFLHLVVGAGVPLYPRRPGQEDLRTRNQPGAKIVRRGNLHQHGRPMLDYGTTEHYVAKSWESEIHAA